MSSITSARQRLAEMARVHGAHRAAFSLSASASSSSYAPSGDAFKAYARRPEIKLLYDNTYRATMTLQHLLPVVESTKKVRLAAIKQLLEIFTGFDDYANTTLPILFKNAEVRRRVAKTKSLFADAFQYNPDDSILLEAFARMVPTNFAQNTFVVFKMVFSRYYKAYATNNMMSASQYQLLEIYAYLVFSLRAAQIFATSKDNYKMHGAQNFWFLPEPPYDAYKTLTVYDLRHQLDVGLHYLDDYLKSSHDDDDDDDPRERRRDARRARTEMTM